MVIFLKFAVNSGVDNCLGETRWFYEIYRNYGKKVVFLKYFKCQVFKYHDFSFSNNILIMSGDFLYYSLVRSYISITFIHLHLCFKICLHENLLKYISLLAKMHNLYFLTVPKNQYLYCFC